MHETVYAGGDNSTGTETGNVKLVSALCHEVAGFAAEQTIILSVGTEADVIPALAEDAESIALTLFFFPIALCAEVGHAPRISRLPVRLK